MLIENFWVDIKIFDTKRKHEKSRLTIYVEEENRFILGRDKLILQIPFTWNF